MIQPTSTSASTGSHSKTFNKPFVGVYPKWPRERQPSKKILFSEQSYTLSESAGGIGNGTGWPKLPTCDICGGIGNGTGWPVFSTNFCPFAEIATNIPAYTNTRIAVFIFTSSNFFSLRNFSGKVPIDYIRKFLTPQET